MEIGAIMRAKSKTRGVIAGRSTDALRKIDGIVYLSDHANP